MDGQVQSSASVNRDPPAAIIDAMATDFQPIVADVRSAMDGLLGLGRQQRSEVLLVILVPSPGRCTHVLTNLFAARRSDQNASDSMPRRYPGQRKLEQTHQQ